MRNIMLVAVLGLLPTVVAAQEIVVTRGICRQLAAHDARTDTQYRAGTDLLCRHRRGLSRFFQDRQTGAAVDARLTVEGRCNGHEPDRCGTQRLRSAPKCHNAQVKTINVIK